MTTLRIMLIITIALFSSLAGGGELNLSFEEIAGGELNGSRIAGIGFLNATPRVVYINTMNGALTLFDLDKRQFTSGPMLNPSGPTSFSWSPDNNRVAYQLKNHIYVYDITSRHTSKLAYISVPTNPIWHNNREFFYLFYERHQKKPDISQIRLLDVTNGISRTLFAQEGDYTVEDFAENSQQLFFSHRRREKGGDHMGRLALYKADFRDGRLQNQKMITDYGVIDGGETSFSVTRDGKYAAAVGLTGDRRKGHSIYLIDIRTGKYLRVWESGLSHSSVYINGDGSAILARSVHYKDLSPGPQAIRYANLDRATIEKLFAELK